MSLVCAALIVAVAACVSFDLDRRRFRCAGNPTICETGWVCGADGYCARDADASIDTAIDAPVDAPVDTSVDASPNLPGEICGNNIDDEPDGLVDCADPECPADTTCGVGCGCVGGVPTEQACMDTLDNDRDGQRDCLDSDCPGQCAGQTVCCPDGACRVVC